MEALTFERLPEAVTTLTKEIIELKRLLLTRQIQPPIEQPEKLLTVQQAADFLKLSVATIYGKVSRNELPVMKRGKRLYFSQKELLEYLKKGRNKTNSEIEEEAKNYFSTNKKRANAI